MDDIESSPRLLLVFEYNPFNSFFQKIGAISLQKLKLDDQFVLKFLREIKRVVLLKTLNDSQIFIVFDTPF